MTGIFVYFHIKALIVATVGRDLKTHGSSKRRQQLPKDQEASYSEKEDQGHTYTRFAVDLRHEVAGAHVERHSGGDG